MPHFPSPPRSAATSLSRIVDFLRAQSEIGRRYHARADDDDDES